MGNHRLLSGGWKRRSRVLTRSQKNVLLLINNLKSRLNGLLVGESSGNWHRKRGLLLYTYYGTVLAMWLFA
ncbi:MAG: hypothetical protein F6K54_26935 [Okeania sp. SIO3B5]|uniref:hypothetical protein n=1 Tax=Okeania sp. SIO3B5 TaxID=2607811 RepID=UPI0014013066|nr:hypothetical protein [Okeania sp. SIO3B5]NEO56401.1 hypothetical protein [Okeania sp. SIO3B5]